MYFAYRPLVYSCITDLVCNSRLKNYEIKLEVTKLLQEENKRFKVYSSLIREEGRVTEYLVKDNDGNIVSVDPIASAVGRHNSEQGGSMKYASVKNVFLPECFCNAVNTDVVPGGVLWMQCTSGEKCVSFRDGWVHQRCVFLTGDTIPDMWTCMRCETGARSPITLVTAGAGVGDSTPKVRSNSIAGVLA